MEVDGRARLQGVQGADVGLDHAAQGRECWRGVLSRVGLDDADVPAHQPANCFGGRLACCVRQA
eukprot:9497665-Pyramimonas_sp.AAC.1